MSRIRRINTLGTLLLGFSAAFSVPFFAAACSSNDASESSETSDAGIEQDGDPATDGAGGGILGDALLADTLHSDGEAGEPLCGGQTVMGQPVVANLLIIIDRSGSMLQIPPGFTDSKWVTMVDSLKSAMDGVQDRMKLGLLFLPDPEIPSTTGCGMSTGDDVLIGIDEGTLTVPLINAALQKEGNKPEGNTPVASALDLANRYFTMGSGKDLDGEKYILLALDGGPNCNPDITCDASACTTNIDRSLLNPNVSACPIHPDSCCETIPEACLDDQATVAFLSALWGEGIPTFVVGIPGSDLYAGVLDDLAVAGGVPASDTSPRYFEAGDPGSLTETLIDITRSLVRNCEFQLEEDPPDPDKVNVFIDGEVLPQQGDDGWHYDNSTSPPTIVITGKTCEHLESEGAEAVTFEFGCPTIIVK